MSAAVPRGEADHPRHAEVDQIVSGLLPRLVAIRRDIHAHPERAWTEVRTTAVVAHELAAAGLAPRLLEGGTGLTCDIAPGASGDLVALRADLDALPIDDEKEVAYRSTVPGTAHACGHDVHTTVVLGAGLTLAGLAATGQLGVGVRVIFQPAEEVLPGGALAAIRQGALVGVGRAFALHCDPRVDAGRVAGRTGPITAATDAVTVRLAGPGGHTARPQVTADVVGALGDVVSRTPTLLSRRVDPLAGLSLVWGLVHAGSAANVMPEHGEASGSVRVADREVWHGAADLVCQLIRDIAGPYGVTVETDYVPGVPPAVNDPTSMAIFTAAAERALGEGKLQEAPRSMGAEDFAWFLERVPGVLGRLGVRRPGATRAPDLHTGDFDVDEAAIACGVRVLTHAALHSAAGPSSTARHGA